MSKGHDQNSDKDENGGSKVCRPVQKARNVIVFGLICGEGHEFEGWFRSNQDFDDQTAARSLACPACHSTQVQKGIMAPNLNISGSHAPEQAPERPYGEATDLTDTGFTDNGFPDTGLTDNGETIAALEAEIADMRRQIKDELRDYVETNFDYVGPDFPEEARRRHDDVQATGVYGEATVEDMMALIDEGITVAPLPQDRKKLN